MKSIVKPAFADFPKADAVIVIVSVVATCWVTIVNVAVEAPAATITCCGILTLFESPARFTATPPLGADPLRLTVPVTEPPPFTVVGDMLIPDKEIGTTSKD